MMVSCIVVTSGAVVPLYEVTEDLRRMGQMRENDTLTIISNKSDHNPCVVLYRMLGTHTDADDAACSAPPPRLYNRAEWLRLPPYTKCVWIYLQTHTAWREDSLKETSSATKLLSPHRKPMRLSSM